MKPYPKYKDSGIEWIGEIPDEWEVKSLKFIAKIVLGKMLTNEDKGEYFKKPYLRAQNIMWEQVNTHNVKEMWFSEKELSKYRLSQNDLLVSEGGEVGRTSIWKKELGECYIQNSVHKVTITSLNSPNYYMFHFEYFGKTGYFDSIVSRVSIAHLTREKLKDTTFIAPPAQEQTQISNYLDHKTNLIDTLIEKKQKQIELLKEQRTAIINQAVTKGLDPNVKMKNSGIEWLGEIPESWKMKQIKHLLKRNRMAIKTGPFGSQLKSSDIINSGIKVYNQRNVLDNDFNKGENYISFDKFAELKGFEIFPEDILITSRGTIGRCAIFQTGNQRGVLHPCLIRMQINQDLMLHSFLLWFIQDSVLFKESVFFNSNATTIEVIYSETLKRVHIPVPSLREQNSIVRFLRQKCENVDNLINQYICYIETLKEYRTTLISEAVTGKIDVRDEVIQ